MPLIALTWTPGLLVATDLTFGKCLAEILISESLPKMIMTASVCFICASIGSWFVVFTLSIAMKYYDNIDALPMFQSFLLLSMLSAGLILLDEVDHYTKQEVLCIMGSASIVCIGIKVLTSKPSANVTHIKNNEEEGNPQGDNSVLTPMNYEVDSNG